MTEIKLKNSITPGNTPDVSDLEPGEVATNSADGKAFMLKDNGVDDPSIVELGGHPRGRIQAGASVANTGAIISGSDYNITSVAKTATGTYAVVLSKTMANSNYRVHVDAGTAGLNGVVPFVSAKSTTGFSITMFNNKTSTVSSDIAFGFDVIGELA